MTSLIQDVKTRWWATSSMISRLILLKPALTLMEINVRLGTAVPPTQEQWKVLETLEKVLLPFKRFQTLLEGEKYVTISFVPRCVHFIRKKLIDRSVNAEMSQGIRDLSTLMLENFNDYWGSGEDGTVYNQHQVNTTGRERVKGLSLAAMWASLIDPRTKKSAADTVYGPIDLKLITDGMLAEALRVYKKKVDSGQIKLSTSDLAVLQFKATGGKSMFDDDDNVEEFIVQAPAPVPPPPALNMEESIKLKLKREYEDFVLEVGLNEPSFTPLKKGEKHDDPLMWWKERVIKYPILGHFARRILATQATSASSERLFSHAGLTIANDRANLLPEFAEQIILLHDYLVLNYGDKNEEEEEG